MTDPVVQPFEGLSVCLFCGSSNGNDPVFTETARQFGDALATRGWRLVYGGGGVGLMGAAARGAHEAGGRVLGVMPGFLRAKERLYDEVETVVVTSMHERKVMMYDQSDAFVVAPGGVGTLEEVVEVLSWKRLALHDKPVIFLNIDGYWDTLVAAFEHGIGKGMTPPEFRGAYEVCGTLDSALDAIALARDVPGLQRSTQ